MKKSELKSTRVYEVRDANNPTGACYTYQGISKFKSVISALACILALMDKNSTTRQDYVIIEIQRKESLVTL